MNAGYWPMQSEPLIAGIDLGGSKMTVASFRPSDMRLLDVHTYSYKHAHNRSDQLYMPVDYYLDDGYFECTKYFFVEEPLVGRGVRASMQIAQMAGSLLHMLGCHHHGDETMLVPVGTWKKAVVGNGGANKEMVKEWVKENHPVYASLCGDDQDCFDATCIGLFGAAVVTQSRSLTLTGTAE